MSTQISTERLRLYREGFSFDSERDCNAARELLEHISALEAELATAKQDSARLRWARGDPENVASRQQIEAILTHADSLDAARSMIDAAMSRLGAREKISRRSRGGEGINA